jgi:hypothetical protein
MPAPTVTTATMAPAAMTSSVTPTMWTAMAMACMTMKPPVRTTVKMAARPVATSPIIATRPPIPSPVVRIAVVIGIRVRVIVGVIVRIRAVVRAAVIGRSYAGSHQERRAPQKREQGFLQRVHNIEYDGPGMQSLQSLR